MFEHKTEPLLPKREFLLRVLRYSIISLSIIGFSLAIGILGYHYFGELEWLDALLNSSMILAGMGPVMNLENINNNPIKWFASFYAIYSGIAFLTIFAVLLAPALHRFMHILHIGESN